MYNHMKYLRKIQKHQHCYLSILHIDRMSFVTFNTATVVFWWRRKPDSTTHSFDCVLLFVYRGSHSHMLAFALWISCRCTKCVWFSFLLRRDHKPHWLLPPFLPASLVCMCALWVFCLRCLCRHLIDLCYCITAPVRFSAQHRNRPSPYPPPSARTRSSIHPAASSPVLCMHLQVVWSILWSCHFWQHPSPICQFFVTPRCAGILFIVIRFCAFCMLIVSVSFDRLHQYLACRSWVSEYDSPLFVLL
jgi:hypothetical protein